MIRAVRPRARGQRAARAPTRRRRSPSPAKPCGLPMATTSWPTRRRSASPSVGRHEVARRRRAARRGRRAGRAPTTSKRELAAVDERGAARRGRGPATTCARGEQEAVGREHDAAARAGRHAPARACARVTRRFATDGASRSATPVDGARVGVERLALVGVRLVRVGRRPSRRLRRSRSSATVDARAPRSRARPSASSSPPGAARRARRRARRRASTGSPPAATIRSPLLDARRGRPALPSSTAAHQQAVALGQADRAAQAARDVRRARSATPSRGRAGASPRASASTRSRSAASAGTARIRPPSRRTALRPSSRPSRSTSGPPDEPRGSGAVCSIAPGDAAAARAAEAAAGRRTRSRAWRAGRARRGWRARRTGGADAGAAAGSSHATGSTSPVSTATHGEVAVGVDAGHACRSRGGRRRTSR